MKARPKSLMILVAAFAIVPLLNIIGTSFFVHIPPHRYLWSYLTTSTYDERLSTFILPWLAAYCLYKCTRWSYALFTVLMGIVFAENLQTLLNYPTPAVQAAVAVAVLANTSVLIYIAYSENLQLFLNSNLRWWETPSRYRVSVEAKVLDPEQALPAMIKDISINGFFLESPKPLEIGVPIEISFSLDNLTLAVKAKALRRQDADRFAYGMVIEHTAETRKEMKQIISTLKTQGVPTTQAASLI